MSTVGGMRLIVVALAFSLVAAGCGEDPAEDVAGPEADTTTSAVDTTVPATATTITDTTIVATTGVPGTTEAPATTSGESTTTSIDAATTTVPDEPVILSGTAFGAYEIGVATRDETVDFVESFLGPATRVRRLVEDEYITCPSGADTVVSWQDQLLLVFFADVLSGYLWEGDSIPFGTPEGIIINNTVAELQEAYPGLEVTETSLGYEWFLDDGLHGFAEGADPGAFVTAIGGMDMCAFR